MTARMTDVFVINEASRHAWNNLGFSEDIQEMLEERFGDRAYDLAICLTAFINKRERGTIGKINDVIDNGSTFGIFEQLYSSLKNNSKLSKAIRQRSSEIGEPGYGWRLLRDLMSEFPPKEPGQYNRDEKVVLGHEGGWRWVHVDDEECSSYEGQAMQHCGQAYYTMLSLRDPQGKPHVTADVQYDDSQPQVHMLRGKQNSVPDKKYWPYIFELFRDMMSASTGKIVFFEAGPEWKEFRTAAEEKNLMVPDETADRPDDIFAGARPAAEIGQSWEDFERSRADDPDWRGGVE